MVFDADTEATNEKNETPWQIAYAKATTDSSIMDSLQSRYIYTKKRGKYEIVIKVFGKNFVKLFFSNQNCIINHFHECIA